MEPVWLKSYPREVDPSPPIREGSVAELIVEHCERHRGREAFWSRGRSLSFGECLALARAFAGWLHREGVAPGERIALMLPNVLAYPVACYGALLGGQVVVNVNPLYTARELVHQLRDAGARTLVVWEPALPAVEAALPSLELERLVVVGPRALHGAAAGAPPANGGGPRRLDLEAALAAGEGIAVPLPRLGPGSPAFLQYTGGTTGVSKGAVLTQRNVLADLAQQHAWSAPFVPAALAPHRLVTALPLYHIAALMAAMFRQLLHGGSCLLIADPRNVDDLVETLRTQRFTLLGGTNTLYAALLAHPRIAEVDFSACYLSASGATQTQQPIVDRWQALTGLSIVEGYGMTETCCYISQMPHDGRPFNGSAGLPYPLTEISVRDLDGRELGIGEAGEICVRGPQVMAGYWGRPDASREALTEDGYLRTGDIGSVDAEGYLRISDRKKDMILVSGFNVYPNEVEAVLLAHPKVLEAAVVAAPDAHSGEAPVAFVVARDPSLTAAELLAHCAGELTGYKRPRRIEFRATLPKTPVGKILRRALRDEVRG
ncbi:MAG: AMP-binding protein [Proteobacteria bacterium]|nr:AMP-binding protein [Pseudomonadota bacterium]